MRQRDDKQHNKRFLVNDNAPAQIQIYTSPFKITFIDDQWKCKISAILATSALLLIDYPNFSYIWSGCSIMISSQTINNAPLLRGDPTDGYPGCKIKGTVVPFIVWVLKKPRTVDLLLTHRKICVDKKLKYNYVIIITAFWGTIRKMRLPRRNKGFHSTKPEQCFMMKMRSGILIPTTRVMKAGFWWWVWAKSSESLSYAIVSGKMIQSSGLFQPGNAQRAKKTIIGGSNDHEKRIRFKQNGRAEESLYKGT